jgi:hypothetical protein
MNLALTMFNSTRWLLAPAVIGALLGRPGVAQLPAGALADVVQPGCYRLTLGPWSMAPRIGPDQPTAVVRLDTIARTPPVPGDLVAERIEPAEFAPPGDSRLRWRHPASWRRVGADSVVIVAWSTGTEAEVFYGRWARGSLKGVVRRTSDAIPVDPVTKQIQWNAWPWAAASAIKVACP